MCGIVGYIGHQEAQPIILDGLSRIEYRGYDSAGIASLHFIGIEQQPTTELRRAAGKLINLKKIIDIEPCKGKVGIGHTRWATHGKPTEENAHPHHFEGLTLVHNGIIENYRELKKKLHEAGHHFSSETDTEIFLQWIASKKRLTGDSLTALYEALKDVKGSFAMALMDESAPHRIICAQRARPLVIGHGKNEMFIAADFPAALPYTKNFTILQEGDIAIVTENSLNIFNESGEPQQRTQKTLDWSPTMAEKEGYKHFMLKEIMEQPQALTDTLREYIDFQTGLPAFDKIDSKQFASINRISIVACGTSFHAGLLAKYYFEQWLKIPVEVEIASEYRYRSPVITPETLVIGISQSGETADTLAAVTEAIQKGAKVTAICNVLDAALPRLCEQSMGTVYTKAGPEISVASTKSFVTQIVALYLLGLYIANEKKTLPPDTIIAYCNQLLTLPRQLEEQCKKHESIRKVAQKYMHARDMLFLGRGVLYPIALEGALKMKELSYLHAEGYAAGEMKHGPIALIDENMPVVVLALQEAGYEKIVANLEETRARGGKIIVVCEDNNEELIPISDDKVTLPQASPLLIPLLATLPMQLLAYHLADLRGTDVDQPRNLAKSVTVE